jgi:hypothetical protein
MADINDFIKRISEFDSLKSSEKIDYIVYFLLIIEKRSAVTSSEVKKCFEDLHTVPYSNIPSYLSRFSKGGKGQKFLKKGTVGYLLERKRKEQIDLITKNIPIPKPSDDLFPIILLDNTRGYILRVAEQASVCYNIGMYDASLVMIRKLLETLIIECFERYGIESNIKGHNGNYFFLSDLIGEFFNSACKWSVSRNTSQSLPKIKSLGDLSAHNRRFNAKKSDIDKIKDDLRIVIEDLVLLIDYPNWNR